MDAIEYNCPDGYVFEIYSNPFEPTINWGLITPETDFIINICERWGEWTYPEVPKCIPKNCTLNPFKPPMNDLGMYDWNENVANNSITKKVKYWCPQEGWGYPKTGNNKMTSECQLDKTWSLPQVDECISK